MPNSLLSATQILKIFGSFASSKNTGLPLLSTNALKIFAVAPFVALKVCAVRPNELFAVPLPMVRIEFVLVNLNSLLGIFDEKLT